MPNPPEFIRPDWPAPARVRAAVTTRQGGVSAAPYASLNLGSHVGDAPEAVAENRRRVSAALALPQEPAWLNQVHGTAVVRAEAAVDGPATADASVALGAGSVCAVMTADCLPVLFCDDAGTRVAAAHAGWRGLEAGVLEATILALDCSPAMLMAWLGPAIGPSAFEVGPEVRAAFLARDPGAEACFVPSPAGRWLADIYRLARRRLNAAGVTAIYGGDFCTVGESARFFSYRRDRDTGRFASLIWLMP